MIARRLAAALLSASLLSPPLRRVASALEPRQALEPLLPQSARQQISDAIPLKSMRGVWRLRETRGDGGPRLEGKLMFTGAADLVTDSTNRNGAVVYTPADGGASASGVWVLKTAGFGRDAMGRGVVEVKAAWKLRRDGGKYVYSGRVRVPYEYMAFCEGDVKLLGGADGRDERLVGGFEAELLRPLSAEEENAASAPTPVTLR